MADDLGTVSPPGTNFNILSQQLGAEEAQVNADLYDRQVATQQLAKDSADNPISQTNSDVGPRPKVFDYPVPQEHFDRIMGQAPLLMALAAVGGSFGRQHGLNMLATTNAMMKGLVQGSDAAYQDARKKYDDQYAQYQDKQKTWMDVYKTYQAAYKGRIDVDEKAITSANRSVGIDQAHLKLTRQQIMLLPQIQARIAKSNADISHMSAEEMIQWANLDVRKKKLTQDQGKVTQKSADASAEAEQLLGTIDEIDQIIDSHNFVTGFGGTGRRLEEYVKSTFTGSTDLPATKLASDMHMVLMRAPEVIKMKGGRMGVDQRRELNEAISALTGATSGPMAKEKLETMRRILKDVAKPDVTSGTPSPKTKTLGGVTYTQGADGKWFTE